MVFAVCESGEYNTHNDSILPGLLLTSRVLVVIGVRYDSHCIIVQWIGTVGSTVFWDALIAHVIVHQAEVRGIGVYTAVELFNEIVDLHFDNAKDISPRAQIQIARAVGVAIVKQGSMYPTMELLLRHAIQYLGLRGKSVVAAPGVLDNEDDFIMDLGGIDPEDPDAAGLTKEE